MSTGPVNGERYLIGGAPFLLGPLASAQTIFLTNTGSAPIEYTVNYSSGMSSAASTVIAPGYRVGLIGTSLQQQNDAGNANSLRAFSRGWWTWFQTLYGEYLTPVWHDPSVQIGFEPDNVPGTTRFFRGYNAGVFGSTIDQTLARVGRKLGLTLRKVELANPLAAVDVDKPADHALVSAILQGRV